MGKQSVDVIIPTYKPDEKLIRLVEMLQKQSIEPERIIVVNTEKGEWEARNMDEKLTKVLGDKREKLILRHIGKRDFDHGASRNYGVGFSEAKYFVCMTMDAVPADEKLLERLLAPMSERIKLSYARQLPYPQADEIERFTRSFNYPEEDREKGEADKERWGIKTYFCSNVCACYERASFDRIGGFRENIILNEDMLYAHDLLLSGKHLLYVGGARVFHSHSYTGKEQFQRNFDIGVSHTVFASVFSSLKSEAEGSKMVKMTAKHLWEKGKILLLPKLFYMSACKFLGYKLGRAYKRLPEAMVYRFSLHKGYWR